MQKEDFIIHLANTLNINIDTARELVISGVHSIKEACFYLQINYERYR